MGGSVTSKCMRRHKRSDKRCGSRCLRWYYVLEGRKAADGKRQREWSRGYESKKAASDALADELARRAKGITVKRERVTVADLGARWIRHLTDLGRDEATVDRYAGLLRLHIEPHLGDLQLKELEPTHLQDLYALLLREGRKDGKKRPVKGKPGGLAPRTVLQVHGVVHAMLRQAVRWRLVAYNAATDLELPSARQVKQATLTQEQAGALLDAAEAATHRPWLYPVVLLGLATGARLGELLALTWDRVDLDSGAVEIGASRRMVKGCQEIKGPKSEAGYRTVLLGPATVAVLRRLRTEQTQRRLLLGPDYDAAANLVVCKADGRPYRPDSCSSMFRKFVDGLGLPREIHTHTLRHAAASFLSAAGVVAPDIAGVLGHADGGALAMRTYIRPLPEGIARAGELLDRVIRREGEG